jgi:hypothetical protein
MRFDKALEMVSDDEEENGKKVPTKSPLSVESNQQ